MGVHTKVDKTPGGQMARDRYAELKRILDERRREILSEVHEKIRDVRIEGANNPTVGVLDAAESSESDIQDDIEFALIQMKAETLHKIEEALRRLEEGTLATASSAPRKSPSGACVRYRLRCAARTARRRASWLSSVSGSRPAAARRRSSSTSGLSFPAGPPVRRRRAGDLPTPPHASRNRATVSLWFYFVRPISTRNRPRTRPPMSDRDEPVVVEEAPTAERLTIPDDMPVLPLRDTVLFPNSFMPLAVARESSVRLIDDASTTGS